MVYAFVKAVSLNYFNIFFQYLGLTAEFLVRNSAHMILQRNQANCAKRTNNRVRFLLKGTPRTL